MMSFNEFERRHENGNWDVYVKELSKLQDETEAYNKKCYRLHEGVRLINIVNCDRILWNASSICSILYDDLHDIDNRIGQVDILRFNKFLKRIVCSVNPFDCDKKIKDWFCRNYRNIYPENNKELNKMIRNNYTFYYKNKHEQLWK